MGERCQMIFLLTVTLEDLKKNKHSSEFFSHLVKYAQIAVRSGWYNIDCVKCI